MSPAQRDAFTSSQAQAWQTQVLPALEALGFSTRSLKTTHNAGSGHVARCSLKTAAGPQRVHMEFMVYVNARASRAGRELAYEAYLQVSLYAAKTFLRCLSVSAPLTGADPQEWAAQLFEDLFDQDKMLSTASLSAWVDQQLTL